MKIPTLFGSPLVDCTAVGMVALKLAGVLAWPWWRVTFPAWGSLGVLVGGWLAWRILRAFVRAVLSD